MGLIVNSLKLTLKRSSRNFGGQGSLTGLLDTITRILKKLRNSMLRKLRTEN